MHPGGKEVKLAKVAKHLTRATGATSAISKVELEKAADSSGIGFAFGGVNPGTLHARGKIFETHQVSYSIGRVGTYLLHVRLRQASASLPGSPFRLVVEPNVAHAAASRLLMPPSGRIEGLVGKSKESGCGATVVTYDIMGNRSITGGAVVTSAITDKLNGTHQKLDCEVTDNGDGTYALHWSSDASGTYDVTVKIADDHVLGSPVSIRLTSVTPMLAKTLISGACIEQRSVVAGLPSRFELTFADMYDNPAVPGPRFKFGLALVQGRSFKDIESHPFAMKCIDELSCTYEVVFTAKKEGAFDLHVWADDLASTTKNEKVERVALAGSPFPCVVTAGAASPGTSFVDGWCARAALGRHCLRLYCTCPPLYRICPPPPIPKHGCVVPCAGAGRAPEHLPPWCAVRASA